MTEKVKNDRRLMADFLPEKGTEEELERISSVNYITDQYPPVFVMTATGDFLKDQAPILTEKLMECAFFRKYC